MGALYVCGVLIVLLLACELVRRHLAGTPAARARRNAKARDAYAAAWFKTYPHELADGSFQWYSVVHEMDDGRAPPRG